MKTKFRRQILIIGILLVSGFFSVPFYVHAQAVLAGEEIGSNLTSAAHTPGLFPGALFVLLDDGLPIICSECDAPGRDVYVAVSEPIEKDPSLQPDLPFIVKGLLGSNSISLDATVSSLISECPGADSVIINSGEEISYCWELVNTGSVTLEIHQLTDTKLGEVTPEFAFELVPGGSISVATGGISITETQVSTSTWTSFNPGPTDIVTDTDTVTVYVRGPEPVFCNGPAVGFEAGIPTDWAVINNLSENPVEWTEINGCGESGNFTGGSGNAACASSDLQAGGSGLYNTELRTPAFSLAEWPEPQLSFLLNYQNAAGTDHLSVDASIDGGSNWTNLLDMTEDYGVFRTSSGKHMRISLADYAGEPEVILRWHYYDSAGSQNSTNWYAQIDEVQLVCEYWSWLPVILNAP